MAIKAVSVLFVATTMVAASTLSFVAGSTAYDGRYTGQMACDVIQGQTTRPLRTDFLLRIADCPRSSGP